MNTFLNIIWIVFGGLIMAAEYLVASLCLMVTIIGIPFGLQTLKLAGLALLPFGKETRQIPEQSGCLNLFMNIFWLIFGGIEICLSHLLLGAVFCITIVGIPFGMQHFKLAFLSLTPFGKEITYCR